MALAFSVFFSFLCCLVIELIEYIEWKHFANVPFNWLEVSKKWAKAALIQLLVWAFIFFTTWFILAARGRGLKGC